MGLPKAMSGLFVHFTASNKTCPFPFLVCSFHFRFSWHTQITIQLRLSSVVVEGELESHVNIAVMPPLRSRVGVHC
jgi:hypothetical protein